MNSNPAIPHAYAPLDPQAALLIEHLDEWMQVKLLELPDLSFQSNWFEPALDGTFATVYTKAFPYKTRKLFDTCEVMLADVDVKKLVFKGLLEGVPPTLSQFLHKLATWLGKDIFQNTYLLEEELKSLEQGQWAGRKWLIWFNEERRLPLMVDVVNRELQFCIFLPV